MFERSAFLLHLVYCTFQKFHRLSECHRYKWVLTVGSQGLRGEKGWGVVSIT